MGIPSDPGISTHALTEGDEMIMYSVTLICISTHALTEGDVLFGSSGSSDFNFNSRPHGGRQAKSEDGRINRGISTHALTEGDAEQDIEWAVQDISTHALTEGDSD